MNPQQNLCIISGRIRLARNLAHTPFPSQCSADVQHALAERIRNEAMKIDNIRFRDMSLSSLATRHTAALVERHLISKEFASKGNGRLLLSEDESISIMINEEDHLRIQVLCDGFDLLAAFRQADYIDTALDSALGFAYDNQLGYLTQCPTNLGTGLRASYMLHLPALREFKEIHRLSEFLSKRGIEIRGCFGEGSKAYGAFYQISNRTTLGIDEESTIQFVESVASQIIDRELEARKKLVSQPTVDDRVWRALGILKTARSISHNEAVELLSLVRLGICEEVLPAASVPDINRLMTEIQPGCIMTASGADMEPSVRDRRRAEIVRIGLAGCDMNG